MKSVLILLLDKYYPGDQIKKNELGWKYVTYMGVWWVNLRERDHLGRLRRRWEDNIEMYIK